MATPSPAPTPRATPLSQPPAAMNDELHDSITLAPPPPPAAPATSTTTNNPTTSAPSSPDNRKRSIHDVDSSTATDGKGDSVAKFRPSVDSKTMVAGSPAPKKLKLTEEEKKAEKEAKEKERKAKEEEKEQKRLEKEERKRQKEEEKAKKEEEKRKRDEEKRKKDEAKEEEKAKKEEERRKKEEEKRRREEDKQKKERSQLRLNNFFTMASPKKAAPVAPGPSTAATATSPAPEKQQLTDYRKYFQPFFIKPNVKMATAPFPRDGEYRRTISEAIDAALAKPLPPSDPAIVAPLKGTNAAEIAALLHIAPHKRNRAPQFLAYSTKDIVARINAPDDPGLPPIGPASKSALNKSKLTPEYYLKLLNSLPNKYLRFAEDVRPPYCGTFTRKPTTRGLQRGAKPFDRSLPGVNYDYDSEAEWVADDDGEDLMTDDEDDKDSIAGSDDLDGFLDDEDDVMMKRGALGALVATNSGLCWEDEKGKNPRPDLDEMRIEVLMEGVRGPIDPFSTAYWCPPPSQKPTVMAPPRQPLASSNQNLAIPATSATTAPTAASTIAAASSAGRKIVPPEEMENFRRAIDGSDMTKAGLIEVLKKAFPKITKDAIKNTLDLVAERVGDKKDDKRWVLKN